MERVARPRVRYVALAFLVWLTDRGGSAYDPVHHVQRARVYGSVANLTVYSLDVLVGTPPQRMQVILDTASRTSVIPCSGCSRCGSLASPPSFNVAASSTARWRSCGEACTDQCTEGFCAFEPNASAGVEGFGAWFDDHVRLGDAVQGNPAVTGSLACRWPSPSKAEDQQEFGVLGIAPTGLTSSPTLLQELLNDHAHIESTLFSLCLAEGGGWLHVGGKSPHHKGGIQYLPLSTKEGIYSLQLTAIGLGDILINVELDSVRLDVRRTFTTVGFFTRRTLLKAIEDHCSATKSCHAERKGACWDAPEGLDGFPNITLVFGEVRTTWQASAYLYFDAGSWTWCYAFEDHTESTGMVLGASWMLDKDVIFDLRSNRLGLAPADCLAEAEVAWAAGLGTVPPSGAGPGTSGYVSTSRAEQQSMMQAVAPGDSAAASSSTGPAGEGAGNSPRVSNSNSPANTTVISVVATGQPPYTTTTTPVVHSTLTPASATTTSTSATAETTSTGSATAATLLGVSSSVSQTPDGGGVTPSTTTTPGSGAQVETSTTSTQQETTTTGATTATATAALQETTTTAAGGATTTSGSQQATTTTTAAGSGATTTTSQEGTSTSSAALSTTSSQKLTDVSTTTSVVALSATFTTSTEALMATTTSLVAPPVATTTTLVETSTSTEAAGAVSGLGTTSTQRPTSTRSSAIATLGSTEAPEVPGRGAPEPSSTIWVATVVAAVAVAAAIALCVLRQRQVSDDHRHFRLKERDESGMPAQIVGSMNAEGGDAEIFVIADEDQERTGALSDEEEGLKEVYNVEAPLQPSPWLFDDSSAAGSSLAGQSSSLGAGPRGNGNSESPHGILGRRSRGTGSGAYRDLLA